MGLVWRYFMIYLDFCVFEFFSSGLFFLIFLKIYFIGDLLHCLVYFEMKSCHFCVSMLPWIIEYIVLYLCSPWSHSSVGLYQKINSLIFPTDPLCKGFDKCCSCFELPFCVHVLGTCLTFMINLYVRKQSDKEMIDVLVWITHPQTWSQHP